MASTPILNLVYIHGLPESQTADPHDQLKPIQQHIDDLALTKISFLHHPISWTGGDSAFTILRNARKGNAIAQYAPQLESQLIPLLGDSRDTIIFAYSAGGTLVYDFLANRASREHVQCVKKIFILSSQYQCLDGFIYFANEHEDANKPLHRLTYILRRISPKKIITKLRAEQLEILLAENDKTVHPKDADLTLDKEISGNNNQVIRREVPEANHRTIRTSPFTHSIIEDYLKTL